ncbi:MAG: DUF2974 domain-containing protein [Streptococcaceae bacterium]|jgi:hypothetical protein|nr:DUF2974 domain-containing protein [Streptococcaceae bacterium]
MTNMLTYLERYGNLPFEKSSFNEIDALILAEAAYFDYAYLIKEEVSCFAEVKAEHLSEVVKSSFNAESDGILLELLSRSSRFCSVHWSAYQSDNDVEKELQFAAITFQLTAELFYLAFRGTDTTFLGWKEDFNMSFLKNIPSQAAALAYVEAFCQTHTAPFYLGGHSKGGHLAVYAGIKLAAKLRQRLRMIYNFDGPGFNHHALSYQAEKLARLIYKVVPQGSMVGVLFDTPEHFSVIKSTGSLIWQHDPFTWSVQNKHFEVAAELDLIAKYIEETVPTWLESLDEKTISCVIDAVYQAILETGVTSMLEVSTSHKGKGHLRILAKKLRTLDSKAQQAALVLIKQLFATSLAEVKDIFDKDKWR